MPSGEDGAQTLARRTFDVIDVVEILTHWYAGRSQNELATSLGVDRKTLRKYTAPAVAAGMVPGGPPMDEQDWRRLAAKWFPQLIDYRLRQMSWPQIEPHRDYIAEQVAAEVTVATIHQRLRDEHGLTASVASVRRWVRATLPEQARRAQVTVLGDAPPPGEQAQIDYGRLGMWLDPSTGRRRAVWAFVMVLACSRHLFVRPTLVMDQAEWTAAHVEAFAFFGGVPARLVPDNLKTGVDRPDLYDPKINRSYAELAAHYGTLVDPARAAKPRDKPQVERPMPYVRDSFWRGREFGSLAEMRTAALSRTGFDGDHQANREQDRMSAPRKFPDELRQRAIRLVRDAGAEPGTSRKEACRRVGQQLGISPETLRGWVNRAEIDDGDKPGVTTETAARIAELERENRELRRANAILKSASAFFAAELDRPSR
jgi:transposase/transposase-like protein